MPNKDATPPKPATPFERFTEFTKRLMGVPKKEIDAEERKYQRRRARRKKR